MEQVKDEVFLAGEVSRLRDQLADLGEKLVAKDKEIEILKAKLT